MIVTVGPHYQTGRNYAGCPIIVDEFRADIMVFYEKVKNYTLAPGRSASGY